LFLAEAKLVVRFNLKLVNHLVQVNIMVAANSLVGLASHLDQGLAVLQLVVLSYQLSKWFAAREELAVRIHCTFVAAAASAFAIVAAFAPFSNVLAMIVKLVAIMES
jgi:hypothetical protein